MSTQETKVPVTESKDPVEIFYREMQTNLQLAIYGIVSEGADKANELQLSIAAPAQCLGMSAVSAFYEILKNTPMGKDPLEFKSTLEKLSEMMHEAFTTKLDLLFDPESELSKLRSAAEKQGQVDEPK